MRVHFALPGFHRYDQGTETAFNFRRERTCQGRQNADFYRFGASPGSGARFLPAASSARENFESFPSVPALRNECEELALLRDFYRRYRPVEYDVTLTCSYPFTKQNGDWPAYTDASQYLFFEWEV
jgi:hypothetical protein